VAPLRFPRFERAARRALAGSLLAAGLALAPPAALAAGPASVHVRVEGAGGTLLPRTQVTAVPGSVPACPPSAVPTAADALEAATAGAWDRQAFTSTILGESHAFGPDSDYWAEWLNSKLGGGICNDAVSAGDDVLLLVDYAPPPSYAATVFSLELRGVPAAADAGAPFTVTAVEYRTDGTPGTGVATPAAGVTVTGGDAPVTTGPDGTAAVTVSAAGTATLRAATAGNRSRSVPAAVCVHAGGDGNCGTAGPAGSPGPEPAAAVMPPAAAITALKTGQRFEARRAPRLLRGTVRLGSARLATVRLRLLRQRAGRCQYWSVKYERFRGSDACAAGPYRYGLGDRADWSYLLPERLPAGHFTLEITAIALDGGRSVQRAAFTVLAPPAKTPKAHGVTGR
jgi:hypothetical protein